MQPNFNLYSRYYDLLYKDKDYDAESNYIIELIQRYKSNSESILELGSGTGKHAQRLANAGFKVTGVERSEEMVAIARANQNSIINYLVSDISSFKINEKYDVATSLFHVISYLTDNIELINTFKNVNLHLKEQGVFIFDVWHSSAVNYQKPEKRTKVLEDEQVRIIRVATPQIHAELNVVDVNYDILIEDLNIKDKTKIRERHPMRHFAKPEIEILAFATGFEVIHTEEFITKAKPSHNTWGVCYVLRKV